LGFRELRCLEWGRNAGCGQECPPHTNCEKPLAGYEIIIGTARSRARLRPGSLLSGNGSDSSAPKMETLLYTHGFLDVNGVAVHGHGACRVGNQPKRNNPALAILTLAYRASDYMADEIRAGRV